MTCCVINLDRHKDLWEYDYIKQNDIMYEMFNGDIINVNDIYSYNDFDKSDVMNQYSKLEIDTLDELKVLIDAWNQQVIVRFPYEYEDAFQDYDLIIVIYDYWNE